MIRALAVVPVGATQASGAGLVPDHLTAAFPGADLSGLTSVGLRLEPDLEAIAALRPDLLDAAARVVLDQLAAG